MCHNYLKLKQIQLLKYLPMKIQTKPFPSDGYFPIIINYVSPLIQHQDKTCKLIVDASLMFDAVSMWSNLQTMCGKYQNNSAIERSASIEMNQEITDPPT